MLTAALLIGIIILAQGMLGLVSPDTFVTFVGFFQIPPVLYVAAIIRVLIGAILVMAAQSSRAPMALRLLGGLIVVGGLLTPVIGVQFAKIVLRWWLEGGAEVVRVWASFSLILGLFVVYATAPRRRVA